MSEVTYSPEEMDAIHSAVAKIAGLLAAGEFESTVQACSETRLSADDIRNVIHKYGRRVVVPPEDAYASVDVIRVARAEVPTWSVTEPCIKNLIFS